MDLRTAHARIAAEERAADEVYDAVRRRGRRRRAGRGLASAALVVAVLGGGGALALAAGGDAAGEGAPADAPTVEAPDRPPSSAPAEEPVPSEGPAARGSVSLRAADWEEAVAAGRRSVAAGAPYVVTDATGAVVQEGNVGTYGEAIIGHPVGEVTIAVATLADGTACGFRATVVLRVEDRGTPLALRCS